MKMFILITLFCEFVFAGYVGPHFRNNGTFVSGHERSNPDKTKSNNYGRSKSKYEYAPFRDSDRDGMPNSFDTDDNNNFIYDDLE